MEEQNFGKNYNPNAEVNTEVQGYNAQAGGQGVAGLPEQVSIWSKIKAFLLQDVNREIEITMTPYQRKVLKEVHDFWFQEVNFGKIRDFLFQEVTIGKKK